MEKLPVESGKLTNHSGESSSMHNRISAAERDFLKDLKVGSDIRVGLKDISVPVESQFVGMETGEYVLIRHPAPFQTVKSKIVAGNNILITCLIEGQAVVFQTRIIDILYKPVRILALEYPAEFILRNIRMTARTICALPVNIISESRVAKKGVIVDISNTGCQIIANYKPQEKNYILRTADKCTLASKFPGISEEVGISGIIRNARKSKLEVSYGVQFNGPSEKVKLILDDFIRSVQDLG